VQENFTVGSGGKILSYNGSGWITEPAQTFNSINDIWAASPYNLLWSAQMVWS
jgi:hypothetical protein